MDLPAILERSAERIDTYGWRQGPNRGHRRDAPTCLVEAVQDAACDLDPETQPCKRRPDINRALRAVSEHVWPGSELGTPGSDLVRWNDEKGRTEGEVRDALLHTAKELRNANP